MMKQFFGRTSVVAAFFFMMLAGHWSLVTGRWSVGAEEPSIAASKAKQQAEAAAQLGGSEWAVECTSMSGEKKKPMNDTLTFEQGTLTSAMLTKDGYTTSNYTLSIGEDGIPVWETMQTHAEKGNAFWRGELHGDKMSGVFSHHASDGTAHDYSFLGQRTASVAAAEAAAPAVPATPPAPSITPAAAEQPKKKKKSWFVR